VAGKDSKRLLGTRPGWEGREKRGKQGIDNKAVQINRQRGAREGERTTREKNSLVSRRGEKKKPGVYIV